MLYFITICKFYLYAPLWLTKVSNGEYSGQFRLFMPQPENLGNFIGIKLCYITSIFLKPGSQLRLDFPERNNCF